MRPLIPLVLLPLPLAAQGPEIDWQGWAMSSLLVIAAILALGWLLRKTRLNATLGGNRRLRVVATLALGSRERVVVVQAGEEQFLLGVTAQQITQLGRLEQPLVVTPPPSAPGARHE
ncbi:flagellar biosynthetic protein FliO [Zobellella denitrificans]|jgi:flagellar protein FliO/FliZ|uniref:Flagellar protein n=1 Tax=Zobellella denitrificans TaxID=347534 RepID=A0A231MZT9_9GAMM|nr:flagellar biosynthetic protein FliO [Zobellella denitrificans]ATG73204.1 hypothetical protein AN401_04485 [Zobellella denitrificans]OXS15146.1 flagellar biosynthetic protein FliO [Zobellella denitrificans]